MNYDEPRPISTAPKGSGEDGPADARHPDYVRPPTLLLFTKEGWKLGYYDWYFHKGYGNGGDERFSAWCEVGTNGQLLPTHWLPLPGKPVTNSNTATSDTPTVVKIQLTGERINDLGVPQGWRVTSAVDLFAIQASRVPHVEILEAVAKMISKFGKSGATLSDFSYREE